MGEQAPAGMAFSCEVMVSLGSWPCAGASSAGVTVGNACSGGGTMGPWHCNLEGVWLGTQAASAQRTLLRVGITVKRSHRDAPRCLLCFCCRAAG